jgi:hypothetical protein
MTPSMNVDFANCELSIEELEAIAAGGWFSSAVHWVKSEAVAAVHWAESPKGKSEIGTALSYAGTAFSILKAIF